MNEAKCCHIDDSGAGCLKAPDFEVWGNKGPEDYTLSYKDHLGVMVFDGERCEIIPFLPADRMILINA